MKKYLFFIFNTVFILVLFAQCDNCDLVDPVNNGSYTFPANKKVCFTQNTTLQDVTFENNAKVCIAPNVTLTISTNTVTTTGYYNEFEINGTLNFSNNPSFKSDLSITLSQTGTLMNNSGITITNSKSSIINNGHINMGNTLNFASANAINYFENNGDIDITRINASNGNNTIYNKGKISLTNTFDNNAKTIYINCGEVTSLAGFNLGGARLINTGKLVVNSGNIDFSTTSRVENYGTIDFLGGINGGGNASIYNEGLVRLDNINMNGMSFSGPKDNTKKGYFYLKSSLNPNGAKIGPNLDFSLYTSYNPDVKSTSQGVTNIFNNSPQYVDSNGNSTSASNANVTFDCDGSGDCSAPLIDQINKCPNVNGNFDSYCVKPGSQKTGATASVVGISTFVSNIGFPANIPNGQLVLSSKNKGFVITRVQNSSKIVDPIDGMLIYDKDAKCVKLYNGSTWHCIERSCNE
jgi:hypothetical protein